MTQQDYERWSAPFRDHPARLRGLKTANSLLTRLCYMAYPALLALLALARDGRFFKVLAVPAVSFVLLSLFRAAVNAPRPYEALDIRPLIQKDTHGKSFPSRHVFSIFIIAAAFFYILPPAGVLLGLCGAALAVIRVIAGVHFPRDVAAGALIGMAMGAAGLWLLP